jgi:hypothetical protein
MGSILKTPITWAYKKVFGRDVEDDAKEYLQGQIGEDAGEITNRAIWYGIPAATLGIDISNRIAPNLPLGLDRLPPGKKDYKDYLINAMGAVTGPLQRGWIAADYFSRGDYKRAFENIMPISVSNALAGYRLTKEGALTRTGREIWTSQMEPLRLTPGEGLRKSMGFQPSKLIDHYKKTQQAIEANEDKRNLLDKATTRIANGFKKGDEQLAQTGIMQILEHNEKAINERRFADIIDDKSMQQAIEMRFKPQFSDKSASKTLLREAR